MSSAEVEQQATMAADAAAGALASLPMRKRKQMDGEEEEPNMKILKTDSPPQTDAPLQTEVDGPPQTIQTGGSVGDDQLTEDGGSRGENPPMTKAREVRLDQNRKAARESRRRKKVMIEELQRSVIFFSRANGALKQQNDELTRLLMQAQAHVSAAGDSKDEPPAVVPAPTKQDSEEAAMQQSQAQAVATQAMFESQGFPAAAARAAAQTMAGSPDDSTPTPTAAASPAAANAYQSTPAMQPGATMQAMANFQQAAAAAMQTAIRGMQGIPGVNMNALAATPVGANPQQAYTDTMTALAMQQAAAAAAGQHFAMQQQGLGFNPFGFMQPQQAPAAPQQEASEVKTDV